MAAPNIVFNNTSANKSDTQSSGAGPGDGVTSGSPITATDISTDSGGTVVTIPNADLSNVATDGSHAIYIDGEGFRRITAKADSGLSTANVTAHSAFTGSLTGQTGGIGGTREHIYASNLLGTGHKTEADWAMEIQYTGTDYTYSGSVETSMFKIGSTSLGSDSQPFKIYGTGSEPPVVDYEWTGGSPTNRIFAATNNYFKMLVENIDFVLRNNGCVADIRGWWRFRNCLFTAVGGPETYSGSHGISMGHNSGENHLNVENCKFADWGGDGVNVGGGIATGRRVVITNSQFDGCETSGINVSRCTAHIKNCEIWGCKEGIVVSGNGTYPCDAFIDHCTIYNSDNAAININSGTEVWVEITNNILMKGTTYGIDLDAAGEGFIREHHNCIYDFDTAAVLNFTLDSDSITSDPSFVDAASNDFSLGASSPCLAAGVPNVGQLLGGAQTNYRDMGARQRECTGSGGGSSRLVNGGLVA